jgi:hypothetical protein
MNKLATIALLATVGTIGVAPKVLFAAEANQQVQAGAEATANGATVSATTGKMLYGPDGRRIASVYRAGANGDAQIIIDGRLLTVPASSLSLADGKLATSLTKKEIVRR